MVDTSSRPDCPACGEPVKPTWRICPECEAKLVCPDCGHRFAVGETACPTCAPAGMGKEESPPVFKDPVCGMEFVLIPAGIFHMGDTHGQGIKTERPVHEVTLDDFYMARYPVTQAQWCTLIKKNPSNRELAENPVVQMTWPMAVEFAERLTAAVSGNMTFSLPSEAQWEYAARSGGRKDLYAGGADIDAVAWYDGNSQGRSHPVGQKKPNGLGLYDMSGNVWEWCLDTFQEDAYGQYDKHNPVIISTAPDRVIRGGSWNLDAWSARCARRFSLPSDANGPALGFRLVMTRG